MRPTLIALAAAVSMAAAATAVADNHGTKTMNATISESEVLAAQKGWCDALVAISTTNREKGREAAAKLAGEVLDAAYAYNIGPVAFKPTLAAPPTTFRPTRAGALAYFVGGDSNFPGDTGFALKPWTACKAENATIHIFGDTATTMGNVMITGTDGTVTTVDKTWTFLKDDKGTLRIVLHHSSLPYKAG